MRSETYRDLVKASVNVEFVNGKTLLGHIEHPRLKPFAAFVNSADPFIEVHLFDGSTVQLAKAAIVLCHERKQGKPNQLGAAQKGADDDNPLVILGIKAVESREQVRRAYLERMRMYHSDRYGGIELPPEVRGHMETMTKRINVAYRDALAMCEPAAAAE